MRSEDEQRLEASIQQSILNRLGQVLLADLRCAFDVGDRPRDAADFVVRAGAEAELVHRFDEGGKTIKS